MIYQELKQNIGYNFRNNNDDERRFVQELPPRLKRKVSLYIFEDRYKGIHFFKNKHSTFILWFCPMLKPYFFQTGALAYTEGEPANSIHFLKKGHAAYVLQAFDHTPFVNIQKGHMIGAVDIQGSA